MERKDPVQEYFRWLIWIVTPDEHVRKKYRKVFKIMFQTPFVWRIYNDDNRYSDGLDLRLRYSDEHGGIWPEWFTKSECSVLEMMVALALRCEYEIMHDDAFGDRTYEWFWAMMDSSGLIECGKPELKGEKLHEKIRKILQNINNRSYNFNGEGGLFTVKNCQEDLREVEIWYQLNWWLTENYDFLRRI